MTGIIPQAFPQFNDQNGVPLGLGSVSYYLPNTLTFKNTYQDIAGTIVNTNPVSLTASGRTTVPVWGVGSYRQVVKDVFGAVVWDQVTADSTSGELASLASNAAGQGASLIGLQDAGAYFPFETVELALQYLGANAQFALEQNGGGTAVLDNSAALTATLTKMVAAGGGVLGSRSGQYRFSSRSVFDSLQGIMVEGRGGATSGGAWPTQYVFTGGAGVDAFSAQNSSGVRFSRIALLYNNAAFNGAVLNFTGASFPGVEDADIAGLGQSGAAYGLLIRNTTYAKIAKVNFLSAAVGIKGKLTDADFCNGTNIDDCRFGGLTVNAIQDLGSGIWQAGAAENLVGGAPGSYADTFEHLATLNPEALMIMGVWSGDATAAGTAFDFRRRTALNMLACVIGTAANCIALKFRSTGQVNGINVRGNSMAGANSGDTCIDVSGVSSVGAWDFSCNAIAGYATQWNGPYVRTIFSNPDGRDILSLVGSGALDGAASIGLSSAKTGKAISIGLDPGGGSTGNFMARSGGNDILTLDTTANSVNASTVGGGVRVKEGSNAKEGTAVLVGGTATVANTSVTATSRIMLTSQVDGGTPGFLRVSTRSVGTSFTITSSSGTDTSTVAYQIFEPA